MKSGILLLLQRFLRNNKNFNKTRAEYLKIFKNCHRNSRWQFIYWLKKTTSCVRVCAGGYDYVGKGFSRGEAVATGD